MTTYKQTGVDVKLGDTCSRIMSQASDKTFNNRAGETGSVKVLEKKGLHRIITVSFGKYKLLVNSDGIGTKAEFAERMNKHDTMAYDLFAMLCDDAVRYGAEPIAISNTVDVNILSKKVITQLAHGMTKAAHDAGVAVISGEIAELGNRVSGYGKNNYNWGGTVISILKKQITGEKIRHGDFIIGLHEKGFRSNGMSLVRKILQTSYGNKWHTKTIEGKNLGRQALTPSIIYTKPVLKMLSFIHGIAHITGGGIPGKLGRVLENTNYGADITDSFSPSWLMLHCQKIGNVSDREAYKTWNMGQGMVIITDQPEKIIKIASQHKIKSGIIGNIVKSRSINITSKGYFKKGQILTYPLK